MLDGFNPYQAPRSHGDATEAPPSTPRRRFRARIIPTTLSVLLGGLLVVGSSISLYLLSRKPWPSFDPRIEEIFTHLEHVWRTREAVGTTLQLISGLLALASSPFYLRARWLIALVLTSLMIAILALSHPAATFVARLVHGPLLP